MLLLLLLAGSNGELSQQEGQLLEQSVQAILDDYRSQHVAAARNRCMSCNSITCYHRHKRILVGIRSQLGAYSSNQVSSGFSVLGLCTAVLGFCAFEII